MVDMFDVDSLVYTAKFSSTSFDPTSLEFARVYESNWQVFPGQVAVFKSCHDQLLTSAHCHAKELMPTKQNKTL